MLKLQPYYDGMTLQDHFAIVDVKGDGSKKKVGKAEPANTFPGYRNNYAIHVYPRLKNGTYVYAGFVKCGSDTDEDANNVIVCFKKWSNKNGK